VAGLVIIAVARLALPSAPPLYDGIVPIVPYVWLDPPPGHLGGANGATAEITVRNGKSPLVTVATPELQPQAQIFAQPGGLTLPAGSHTIKVSVQPVRTEGTTAEGHIDGNVYRISVTNESGSPLTAPESARVTVVLRATDPAQAEATIARLSGGSWQPLKTSSTGFDGTFLSVVTAFGDFAVITPGQGPGSSVTSVPAQSAGSTVGSATSPAGTAVQPVESNAPGPEDVSSGPPELLLGLGILTFCILGLGVAMLRRRRRSYRGAHPMRRR